MSKPKFERAPAGPKVMEIQGDPAKREELLAALTAEGLFTNAILMQTYSSKVAGDIGITQAVKALRATIEEVNRGDLKAVEVVLVGQAAALNAMFAELARRAGMNMGEHLGAAETYMRLALKAQGQCRATLETLAAIKNPPVLFARQANINNGGQQQVNNGTSPPRAEQYTQTRAHPGETVSAPNRLLEDSTNGSPQVDTRATAATGRAHPSLEPLGAFDGPAKR